MVSSMRERVKEAKYLQCTRRKSFPRNPSLSFEVWSKEARSRQAVLLISPSYILRTRGVEDMPLASSGDPGPPGFSWVLWWAVQKQHSQQLLLDLNYAVHPYSLTGKKAQ